MKMMMTLIPVLVAPRIHPANVTLYMVAPRIHPANVLVAIAPRIL